MDTKNLSPKYLECVKELGSLTPDEQLSLLEKISSSLKSTLGRQKTKHSVMELEGLGATIWKGIDAQEYVRRERESWD